MRNIKSAISLTISATLILVSSKIAYAYDILTNDNAYTTIDGWPDDSKNAEARHGNIRSGVLNNLALVEDNANSTEHFNATENTIGHSNTTANTTEHFNNASLRAAVALWMENKKEALKRYGNMRDWDVSSVTDMKFLFCCHYQSFSSVDVSKWNTSAVVNMNGLFQSAKTFAGDISKWDTSSVKYMQHMFYGAKSFNGDLSKWKTSAVERMDHMFNGAYSFNRDISGWNTSAVTDMTSMFQKAGSFDQDISKWKISNVKNMSNMFNHDKLFNQNLCWNVTKKTNVEGMFCDNKGKFKSECVSEKVYKESCSGGFARLGLPNLVFSSLLGISVTVALMTFC